MSVTSLLNYLWPSVSVHSVINRTPPHLLREVLLIDDVSTMDHLVRKDPGVDPIKLCFSLFSDFRCEAWMFLTNEKRCIYYEMAKLNSKKRKKICVYKEKRLGRIDSWIDRVSSEFNKKYIFRFFKCDPNAVRWSSLLPCQNKQMLSSGYIIIFLNFLSLIEIFDQTHWWL